MLRLGAGVSNSQNVESNGLGQRSTLTGSNVVTFLDSEGWGDVSSKVLMSLFVSVIFRNIVQVVSSDNDGSVHLGGDNSTRQDLTTDRDSTNEWTFLVNVGTFNGVLWGLESQTNILKPSLGLSVGLGLRVGENVRLLYYC